MKPPVSGRSDEAAQLSTLRATSVTEGNSPEFVRIASLSEAQVVGVSTLAMAEGHKSNWIYEISLAFTGRSLAGERAGGRSHIQETEMICKACCVAADSNGSHDLCEDRQRTEGAYRSCDCQHKEQHVSAGPAS